MLFSLTFLPKLTHAAARFVCDSWPTCFLSTYLDGERRNYASSSTVCPWSSCMHEYRPFFPTLTHAACHTSLRFCCRPSFTQSRPFLPLSGFLYPILMLPLFFSARVWSFPFILRVYFTCTNHCTAFLRIQLVC